MFESCLTVVAGAGCCGPAVGGCSGGCLVHAMASFIIGLIGGLVRALDLFYFLLDLNFWLVSTVVAVVSALVHLILCIPAAAAYVLSLCSNLLGLLALEVAELCRGGLQLAFSLVCSLLRVVCGLAESLKMVGHLMSYLSVRGREELQRGLTTAFCSGHLFLKQLWDAVGILASLAAYLVNTIINMFLIGTQNLLSVVAVLGDPLVKATEALASILTYLSSSVVGNVILLWTPCQFVIEVLISVSSVLADVFLLNLYGLAITFIVISSTMIYANPEIMLRIVNQVSLHLNTAPNLNRVRRDLLHFCTLVVTNAQLMVNSETWRRVYSQQLQRLNPGYVNFWPLDQIRRIQVFHDRNSEDQTAVVQQPVNMLEQTELNPVQGENSTEEQQVVVPETSACGPETGDHPLRPKGTWDNNGNVPTEHELWMLLREQEERKKCVICQDQAKSVLLLPCRHLCLCQGCTGILLQQPAYQHNCPLCRQMILQTVDVYF
ncbi:E3 ubiquitin-protein ligase RNF26 [Hemitrygon akajei]|uniref:E3 ubiquitin-protein ligase RNF26 n=1 Tax=Hemitrygon akajei TaxID=2704970 RepID=UPI003BF9E2C6